MAFDANCAIWARGVCKTYGGRAGNVLENLDITVQKGTIYGLLGASGCGKTTLLSALVGSKKMDSGTIRVLGKKPGAEFVRDLGYMPQDIALVGEFTVKGAINHFGWLFGMSNDEIDVRFEFLSKLLDLPPRNQRIQNLSGGQQRRVSLAAVLVHNPEVLILDEPTVGLDPVLRQEIWSYLIQLAEKEGKTIIITTHYIEEAGLAHHIGMMRSGKLLSEGRPGELMDKYNCTNLEDVFLLLSRKQQEGEDSTDILPVTYASQSLSNESSIEPAEDIGKTSWWSKCKNAVLFTNRHHSKALMTKNLQKFFRNKGTLIFCYVFPFVQMSLFFLTVGKDPNSLKVGIVNPEMAPYSTCQQYSDNNALGGRYDPNHLQCNYTGLSCKFILGISEDKLQKVYFPSYAVAKRAAESGAITAILEFNENFTAKTARMRQDLSLTSLDLEQLQINIHLDKSSYPIVKFVERTLFERYNDFTQELEIDCGYNPRASATPFKKLDPVYSTYDTQFINFVAPGCLLMVSIFLAVSVSALSIVTERTEGTWDRTIVAGVSTSEIVIFHFFAMALVNALQNVVLFFVTFCIFGFDCSGSLATVWFLLTCQGIMGTAFGTMISVLSRTVTDCMIISLGLFYPVMVMSGVCWPLEGMHPILRQISYYFVPSTMSVEAMGNIMNRGWSFQNLHVAKGFLSSAGWCILFNFLNIVLLKKEER